MRSATCAVTTSTVDRGVGEQRHQRDGRVRHRGGAQDQGGARRRGHHPDHGSRPRPPSRSARRCRWVRTRPSTSWTTRCTARARWPPRRCSRPRSKTLDADLDRHRRRVDRRRRPGACRTCSAERLGVAALTGARKLTVDGSTAHHRAADRGGVRGRHRLDPGRRLGVGHHQRAALPLVQGDHGGEEEAGARRCRSPTWASPRTRSASPAPPPPWSSTPSGPPRQGGTRVADEGEGGVKLVEFLRPRSLSEGAIRWLRFWFWSSPPAGKVKKATLEALTIARGLGEPSAVVVGAPGTGRGARRQARRVRRGEDLRRRVRRAAATTW